MTRRPKYNRCDYCGRNPHKVAVRYGGKWSAEVEGFCPSCWTGKTTPHLPSNEERVASNPNAEVLYDNRKRR